MRVAIVPIARVTFDLDEAARQVDDALRVVESLGADIVGSTAPATDLAAIDRTVTELLAEPPDVLLVLQATFADASMIVRLHEQVSARAAIPLVCWSFPEPRSGSVIRLNSLCGANLAAFSLRRRDSAAAFVHADPTRCDAADLLRAAIDDATSPLGYDWPRVDDPTRTAGSERIDDAVRRATEVLAGAPIGVIGRHPDGFEPCSFDPAAVAALTGATTDELPLASLFEAADQVTPVELRTIRERVERDLELGAGLADHEVDRSLRLYGGLRSLADARGWKAVATRCWPECTRDYGGAACAPQAMLTADGVPAMCEADVYGGLTALVLREIAGHDPFVTDIVDADRSDGTSVIWHCGQASLTLADPAAPRRGISHPMQGRPLLHEFPLRPGRVTIARISQARGRTSMVIGGGELLQRPRPFAGTCGVLRWDLALDDVMRTIFDLGLEHHVGIVAGDHRDVLVALAARWAIPVVRLGHDHGARLVASASAGADVGP